MRLGFYERAVCLASAARWAESYERIPALLAEHGLRDVSMFLNGPAESEEIERIRREHYSLLHDRPPPITWVGLPGEWCHFLAFKEVVKRAKGDRLRSLLIVEDDLVLAPEFEAVVEAAEVPANWSLLYYGANHTWHPTEDAGRNVLRLHGSLCIHCLGIRASAFDAILALPEIGPADWSLGVYLHHRLAAYAIWPSIALQAPGIRTMSGDSTDYSQLFASRGKNRA